MTHRYRSIRCRHGMCLDTVGCAECGVKPKRGAGQHLLRWADRKSVERVPQSYAHEGGHAMTGNRNARGR